MEELLKKPLPVIPEEIQVELDAFTITLTSMAQLNGILGNPTPQEEVGVCQFPDGSWSASMVYPMPGVTKEMIDWWFWWHCQETLRYQVWFPGDHISIKYNKKDRAYFEQPIGSASLFFGPME